MTTNNSLGVLIILLLAASLAATACAPSVQDVFRDETMDFAAVRTVAVMPLANQTREMMAPERVRDVFVTMLLSTGAVYVLPSGEVARGVSRLGIADPANPSVEDIMKFGGVVKADAVITGSVREYGEVRSGSVASPIISISMRMIETQTGRVVWSASATKGGVSFSDRLLGGGGTPMNEITEKAVNEIIEKLFL
jgi:hypothetical protein